MIILGALLLIVVVFWYDIFAEVKSSLENMGEAKENRKTSPQKHHIQRY